MTIQDDPAASYKLLAAELEKRGYRTAVASDDNVTTVTYTNPLGVAWKTRAALIKYPMNSNEVIQTANDKYRSYRAAEAAGVPVPATLRISASATDDKQPSDFLLEHKKVIVKPNDRSLSMGLTTGITSLGFLKRAIAAAQSFSSDILVQQQVEGEEIRFTVIKGKVEAALLRRTARVIGDGKLTVAELIAEENAARRAVNLPYLSYPQLDETLVRPDLLTSGQIPQEGEIIELSRSTMIRGGCSVYNVLTSVDPSYIKLAEQLARQLHAGFIVVDMFCQGYDEPARAGNHWLIELNGAPVLKLFYSCRDGRQFDILPRLADMIDASLKTQKID